MNHEAAWFELDTGCGRCGYPLGSHRVWHYARDDFEPAVVAAVLEGSINKITCKHCGAEGWITKPFLWVDRRVRRSVFVRSESWSVDKIDAERERLLGLALVDVPPPEQTIILRHLQEAQYYYEIPLALAVDDRVAEAERSGFEDWRNRAVLPLEQRLEKIVDGALQSGTVAFFGDEVTPEFLDVIARKVAELAEDDTDPRAQILRQTFEQLSAYLERRKKPTPLPLPKLPTTEQPFPGAEPERIAKLAELALDQHELTSAPGDGKDSSGPEAPAQQDQLDLAELSRVAFDSDRPKLERADALHQIARYCLNQRRWDNAAMAALQLIKFARELEDEKLEILGLAFAGIAKSNAGLSNVALQYLSQAVERTRFLVEDKAHDPGPYIHQVMPHVYRAAGDAYYALGNLDAAHGAHRHSVAGFEELGQSAGVRTSLRRAGSILWELGDLVAARDCSQKVVELCERRDRELAEALINLAGVIGRQAGPPEIAFEVFLSRKPSSEDASGADMSDEASAARASADEGTFEPPPDFPPIRARAISYYVDNEENRHEFMETIFGDEAVGRLQEARSIARELKDGELEVLVLTQLANLYHTYRMPLGARHAATLCVRRGTELGVRLDPTVFLALSKAWGDIAETAWEAGQHDKARDAWAEALQSVDACIERLSEANTILQNDLQARLQRALFLEALGRREDAAAAYRDVQGRYEGYRQHMVDDRQKRHIQALMSKVHPRAARNALALWREQPERIELAEEAFRHSEGGRSRILLDVLSAPAASASERVLLEKLPRPLTAADIAAALPKGTAVLLYTLVPTFCHCVGSWVGYAILPSEGLCLDIVQRPLEEVYQAQTALTEIIDKANDRLDTAIRRGDATAIEDALSALRDERATTDRLLEELGRLLLPSSLIERFKRHGVRTLVFVPESYLFSIPFSALRVALGRGVQYLIGDPMASDSGFEVIVTPSASAYLAMCETTGQNDVTRSCLLGLSDPELNLGDAAKWMEREVVAAWPGRQTIHLIGSQVTTERMLSAVSGSGTVIFYGHGHYDTQDALDSGLILSNGVLTARRLLEGDVSTRLRDCHTFVLLACSGGRIDPNADWSAREQLGLPIALHLGGVRNVVGALWPLWAHAAEIFGSAFVKQFSEGHTVSEAYRKGMHAIMTANDFWSHPFFWAGLRLMGSGKTRIFSSDI
jgi:CHAT domain-containing protein/tetratricopeptide (TPR) repeat protein